VNVEALLDAREELTAAPEAAQFQWRAACTWRNGTHSRSTVEGFGGLGTEQRHRTTYDFDVDHPECFASEDNGATPVELVLVGLVGCLTAGDAPGLYLLGMPFLRRRSSTFIHGADADTEELGDHLHSFLGDSSVGPARCQAGA
jgi:hypothetical protein